ncbi:MAG: SagB/ThcOx family dehydrogenase [bacterium]|jgi:hypothetical protein
MNEDETLFDKFWEASNLDIFNEQQFSQKLSSYDSDDKELILEYPKEPISLPVIKSKINKISKKRKSIRNFNNEELSIKELGLLLSSFKAWNGLEHRGYPSAGATYVTEIFCVAFNVEKYSGKIIYYDPEKHGIVIISDKGPLWNEASKSLNINVVGDPSMLIIFVSFPDRSTAKYGERGGRFALLEVGAALQQLSLQIAESSKIIGVAVGGMQDELWKKILKLQTTNAHISLGYIIGK